jgi:tetratricopeptide (TPR) repeat protein
VPRGEGSSERRGGGLERQRGGPEVRGERPPRGTRPSGAGARHSEGRHGEAGARHSEGRRGEAGARHSEGRHGEPPTRSAEPAARQTEPDLPASVDLSLLDRSVRAELRSLSKPTADAVAGHLIECGRLLDIDPRRALEHARAARRRAGRVGAVREAVGIAAYHAQEWAEALTELRTARRISGDPSVLPVIADCERALGRPERALRVLSDPDVAKLDPATRVELLIVVAGARRDLGQLDAALAVLARGGLDRTRPRPGAARLWYAYADTLEAADRREEAAQWFAASAAADVDGELDAADRAGELL